MKLYFLLSSEHYMKLLRITMSLKKHFQSRKHPICLDLQHIFDDIPHQCLFLKYDDNQAVYSCILNGFRYKATTAVGICKRRNRFGSNYYDRNMINSIKSKKKLCVYRILSPVILIVSSPKFAMQVIKLIKKGITGLM